MVTWDTAVYKYDEDTGKMIGCSVTIYSDTGDKIDTIEIADATKLQELEDALAVIDSTYVTYTDLRNIIANVGGATNINATTLNGLDGSTFITQSQASSMSFNPKAHASAQQIYGIGSNSLYGHVKIRNDLAGRTIGGEALSAYQGKILNDQISAISQKVDKNNVRILIGRASDSGGEYGTQLVLGYNQGDGVYARIECPDTWWSKERQIRFFINGSDYTRQTNAQGRTEKITINLPRGNYLLTCLMSGVDGKNPVTEQKVIKVQ